MGRAAVSELPKPSEEPGRPITVPVVTMAKAKTEKVETAKVQKNVGLATKCPITRKYFEKEAKPILAQVGESVIDLNVKPRMTSWSFGFHASEKLVVLVGDVPVKCQANLILTVVASKEADEE